MITAIVPAAGEGTRINSPLPKQFLKIKNIPIIIYTLFKLEKHPQIDKIVIATKKEYIDYLQQLIKEFQLKKIFKITEGGETRQKSVWKGICASPESTKLFLIHDAVRPFVSQKLITEVIKISLKFNAAIPAIPVRDTLNKVKNGFVKSNIERANVFHVQTPQGVKAEIIKECLNKAISQGIDFPDESTLLLYFGYQVRIVNGSFLNFKITYPEDLKLVEKLIDCKIETLLERE